MQTLAMPTNRLEYLIRADEIRLHERPRITQRIVVVRLRRKVNDDVAIRDERINDGRIAHITFDEPNAIHHVGEIRLVAGVRQFVDDGDVNIWTRCESEVNEVGADKPSPAGDEKFHKFCFSSSYNSAKSGLESIGPQRDFPSSLNRGRM